VDEKTARDQERAESRPPTTTDRGRKERAGRKWVDEAADARTSDDPRARTPRDATGQPSTRPFDE
jgi:hypothetical protein